MADEVDTTTTTTQEGAPVEQQTAPQEGAPVEPQTAPQEGAPADEKDKGKPEEPPAAQSLLDPDSQTDDDGDGAPEEYADFKFAEGMTFHSKHLEGFSQVAKELGLSQEKAQKIVDQFGSMQAAVNKDISEHYAQVWAEAASKDPEIGGPNAKRNLSLARKAVKEFASPELVGILNQSGLGNHPEFIRLFMKLGKSMSQDSGVKGEASAPAQGPTRRFPKSNMIVD